MGSRPGTTMYVLGNGPSLDLDLLRTLEPIDCIGTNRIALHGFYPGYMTLVDVDVWNEQRAALMQHGCRFFFGVDLWNNPRSGDLPLHRSICFEYDHKVSPDLKKSTLHHGWLTGYYAAAIAARMVHPGGRVVLMGMDLQYPKEEPDHSFGDGLHYGCHDRKFPAAIQAFRQLRDAAIGDVQFVVAGDSALKEHFFEGFALTPAG